MRPCRRSPASTTVLYLRSTQIHNSTTAVPATRSFFILVTSVVLEEVGRHLGVVVHHQFFADELAVANPVDGDMPRASLERVRLDHVEGRRRVEQSLGRLACRVVGAQGILERLQPSTGRFVHCPTSSRFAMASCARSVDARRT